MNSIVPSESKSNVYQSVTANIIRAIEAGAGSFVMPWHSGIVSMSMPTNAATEAPYRGVNVVALWAASATRRYLSGYWASYRQWQGLGAQVRKGERGSVIVFYKQLGSSAGADEASEDTPRFVARTSYVFNVEQVDGWRLPAPERRSAVETNQEIEAFVRATKADVRHGAIAARYRHDQDCIEIPSVERFLGTTTSTATEAYYAVLLHELTHWSGASHRLNRTFGARFGDRIYAFEELVAELGAAFMCSAFGITNEPRPDHAAYVSSWLDILDRDYKAIFTAASKAQEAVEYLAKLAASQKA